MYNVNHLHCSILSRPTLHYFHLGFRLNLNKPQIVQLFFIVLALTMILPVILSLRFHSLDVNVKRLRAELALHFARKGDEFLHVLPPAVSVLLSFLKVVLIAYELKEAAYEVGGRIALAEDPAEHHVHYILG